VAAGKVGVVKNGCCSIVYFLGGLAVLAVLLVPKMLK
jgi:hypothetical protein